MNTNETQQQKAMTPCQDIAWKRLNGTRNMFLTGSAGTGKSFIIQKFLEDKNTKHFPVVASTGAAAIIIDGRTFHSFFGLGIMQGAPYDVAAQALRNSQVRKRIQQAECIIIDEVSMLSGDTLNAANLVCKGARDCDEPWGGLRVIAVGDFAQLPPVSRNSQEKDWAFMHPIWNETDFVTVHMQTVVRSKEERLLRMLDHIRVGNITEEVREFLESKVYEPDFEFEGTRLFAHRRSADQYNQRRLNSLEADQYTFETDFEGDSGYVERLKKNLPITDQLHLKKNALVMIRKNDTKFPYRYINGTLATVIDIDDDSLLLRLLNGKDIEIQKQLFSLLDGNGNELASAYNFPLVLAWATTIHKAQGATIDKLLVDLSCLWESGHAYVALSRVPSEHGLFIEKWAESSIKTDHNVQRFYADL